MSFVNRKYIETKLPLVPVSLGKDVPKKKNIYIYKFKLLPYPGKCLSAKKALLSSFYSKHLFSKLSEHNDNI